MAGGEFEQIAITPRSLEGNEWGQNSLKKTISLPADDWDYVFEWAKKRNLNVSRAIHDLIWMAYHAQKGDFRHFEER